LLLAVTDVLPRWSLQSTGPYALNFAHGAPPDSSDSTAIVIPKEGGDNLAWADAKGAVGVGWMGLREQSIGEAETPPR